MPESNLDILKSAAIRAGDIAMRYWRNAPKTWEKADQQGPVTEADLAVNEMLQDTLCGVRPSFGWLSEETEDDTGRLDAETLFIIDPIDGTRAFVQGERTFAHSLAIARNGRVTDAVVYLPIREKMYSATLGEGSFLNDTPIQVGARSDLSGSDILAARPVLAPEVWKDAPPTVNRHHRTSLAYRLCLVAEGRFDGMLTIRNSWDWDIAAGALILSEAGAIVSDRLSNPLVFNTPAPMSKGVIAANAQIHEQLATQLK